MQPTTFSGKFGNSSPRVRDSDAKIDNLGRIRPTLSGGNASLLIVDEETPSRRRLSAAMARRGFAPLIANTVTEGIEIAESARPDFAIVELRLSDGHGINVVKSLCAARPDCRVVVFTSFGSIASAVAAVKIGATDYLTKPANEDTVHAALLSAETVKPPLPEKFMSPDRARWEHILRVYELCNHNKSETARKLELHRRTLQRILSRLPPS